MPATETDGTTELPGTGLDSGIDLLTDPLVAASVIVPEQDVPGDETTPFTLVSGDRVEEALGTPGDEDWYRLSLGAGEEVSVSVASLAGAPLPEGIIEIATVAGTVLETRTIGDSNPILFSQDQAGDVFLRLSSPTNDIGAYALVVDPALPVPFADPDAPLKTGIDTGLAIEGNDSDKAGRRIDFAFAETGDVFDDRFSTPQAADLDWTDYEKQQLRAALQTFEDVLDIELNEVSNLADAELTLFAAELNGDQSGGVFTSEGFLGFAFLPTGASLSGNVIFNTDGFGWDRNAGIDGSFDGALEQYGLGFQTIIHELGHAFGLDHPYEADASSTMFPGIVDANNDGFTDNIFNDSGTFGLNQTVHTVMADVTGWTEHPDGFPRVFTFSTGLATRPEFGGYVGTPMALDIAVLQGNYGAKENATPNDDVYRLPDTQVQTTGYSAIWDTGGTDEIRYEGTRDAHIDLRPATLAVEDGGGGFVSFANGGNRGDPAIGGFTIAANVVIERAVSDLGADILQGNIAANSLFSGAGNDTLLGDAGNDTLDGGLGDDSLEGGADADTLSYASLEAEGDVAAGFGVFFDLALQGVAQNTGAGTDTASGFENLVGSDFNDVLSGDDDANLIDGGAGRDLLIGASGNDTLLGGEGFDVVEGGAGADALFGGTGGSAIELDVFSYSRADGPLVFNFGAAQSELLAGTSAEILEDTIGDDFEGVIGALGFSNTFDGAGLSEVTLFVGGNEADTFFGGSGLDQLIAGRGDDVLYGGDGIDAFRSGDGNDQLFGGADTDIFQFDGRDGDNTIHDFEIALDQIVFFNGVITQRSQLGFEAIDADGDQIADDAVISYSAPGETSSITFIDIDADTLAADATILLG